MKHYPTELLKRQDDTILKRCISMSYKSRNYYNQSLASHPCRWHDDGLFISKHLKRLHTCNTIKSFQISFNWLDNIRITTFTYINCWHLKKKMFLFHWNYMLSGARGANGVNHCSEKLWVFETDQGQRTQQRSVVLWRTSKHHTSTEHILRTLPRRRDL